MQGRGLPATETMHGKCLKTSKTSLLSSAELGGVERVSRLLMSSLLQSRLADVILTAGAFPFSTASPLRNPALGLSSRPGLEGLRPRLRGDLQSHD